MPHITKREAFAGIQWALYRGAPDRDSLPDGQWGINPEGDYYLGKFDPYDSYYYFNANLSWYFRDNDPSSQTSSSYTSPRGERFLRPSPSSPFNPIYFIGIDPETRREQIFYQDPNGRIIRAFRKYAGETEGLRRFNVRTSMGAGGEEVFTFDVGGREVQGLEDRVVRRLDFGERGRDLREYVEEDDDEVVLVKTERVERPFVDLGDW